MFNFSWDLLVKMPIYSMGVLMVIYIFTTTYISLITWSVSIKLLFLNRFGILVHFIAFSMKINHTFCCQIFLYNMLLLITYVWRVFHSSRFSGYFELQNPFSLLKLDVLENISKISNLDEFIIIDIYEDVFHAFLFFCNSISNNFVPVLKTYIALYWELSLRYIVFN